jgi:hypothetical protein
MTATVEVVPNPNFGSSGYGAPFFSRKTYIVYDNRGLWACASGSEIDAEDQAWAVYQSRMQNTVFGGFTPVPPLDGRLALESPGLNRAPDSILLLEDDSGGILFEETP